MTDSQKWLVLSGLLATGGLLYLLAPVLTPFLIAALLAYVADPLVDRLEARKVSRTLGTIIVFIWMFMVLLALLVIGIPLLEQQITTLIEKLPTYIDWMQNTAAPWVQNKLQLDEQALDMASLKQALTEHWQSAGGVMMGIMASERGGRVFATDER